MEPLDAETVRRGLLARGWDVSVRAAGCTGSTQDDAAAGLRAGAGHGAVFAAERQTRGRGRRGRRWVTTPGGLLFSLVARGAAAGGGWVTMAAAVGAARALEDCTGAAASIKWPNDLLLGGAKVGGVLVETIGPHAVVGVGLNLLQGAGIAAGQPTAAAAAFARRPIDRNELLAACAAGILDCLAARGQARAAVERTWAERSAVLGRRVEVTGRARRRGRVEGFGPDGALLLRDAAGALHVIHAGDVSLRDAG